MVIIWSCLVALRTSLFFLSSKDFDLIAFIGIEKPQRRCTETNQNKSEAKQIIKLTKSKLVKAIQAK